MEISGLVDDSVVFLLYRLVRILVERHNSKDAAFKRKVSGLAGNVTPSRRLSSLSPCYSTELPGTQYTRKTTIRPIRNVYCRY
jgi:hypothetical protein